MLTILRNTTIALAVAALAACGTTETAKKPDDTADKPVDSKPVSSAPRADTPAALIADGTKLLREGKAQEAKAKFAQALTKEPGNFDAKIGEASADIKLGNLPAAQTSLNALQKEKPDNREVIILLGVLLKEKGDYRAGIDLYQNALEKQEKAGETPDPDLLNNMIVLYRLNKDYDEGEKTCRKLLSRDPKNVDALKNLALIYFDQEKYALAETIAINSLKLNDKDAALYNNRGMIRVKKGRYPEAVSFFKKAVEIDPTNISAHLNLGSIALRYRDYDTAAMRFGAAMKLEPRQPEANLGLGIALSGQQKANEAISQLQRALEINPGAAEALAEIAMVNNLQLNKPDEALNWCNKYKDAKGGRLDDKDPTKMECTNIEQTLKNQEMMKKQAEMAKRAAEEEEKANPKPKEAPKPAEGAPAPGPAPATGGGAAPAPGAAN
jgi:tetratricopeptide (TPR) repeat protein